MDFIKKTFYKKYFLPLCTINNAQPNSLKIKFSGNDYQAHMKILIGWKRKKKGKRLQKNKEIG